MYPHSLPSYGLARVDRHTTNGGAPQPLLGSGEDTYAHSQFARPILVFELSVAFERFLDQIFAIWSFDSFL